MLFTSDRLRLLYYVRTLQSNRTFFFIAHLPFVCVCVCVCPTKPHSKYGVLLLWCIELQHRCTPAQINTGGHRVQRPPPLHSPNHFQPWHFTLSVLQHNKLFLWPLCPTLTCSPLSSNKPTHQGWIINQHFYWNPLIARGMKCSISFPVRINTSHSKNRTRLEKVFIWYRPLIIFQ